MRHVTVYQLQKLKQYFYKKYTYKEISILLEQKYGFKISERTMKRIYKENNLKRRTIAESPIDEVIQYFETTAF